MNKLEALIKLFLIINPEPADAQVHALASAIAVDKETLESLVYSMLGEVVNEEETLLDADEVSISGSVVCAADEDVLYDPNIDEDNIPLEDVALTDGDPTDDDLGMQQETSDDGPDVHDVGVGVTTPDSQDVLSDDGVPSFRGA
jgi:hypothetical protein